MPLFRFVSRRTIGDKHTSFIENNDEPEVSDIPASGLFCLNRYEFSSHVPVDIQQENSVYFSYPDYCH